MLAQKAQVGQDLGSQAGLLIDKAFPLQQVQSALDRNLANRKLLCQLFLLRQKALLGVNPLYDPLLDRVCD